MKCDVCFVWCVICVVGLKGVMNHKIYIYIMREVTISEERGGTGARTTWAALSLHGGKSVGNQWVCRAV
jgi:hypothetical protein